MPRAIPFRRVRRSRSRTRFEVGGESARTGKYLASNQERAYRAVPESCPTWFNSLSPYNWQTLEAQSMSNYQLHIFKTMETELNGFSLIERIPLAAENDESAKDKCFSALPGEFDVNYRALLFCGDDRFVGIFRYDRHNIHFST